MMAWLNVVDIAGISAQVVNSINDDSVRKIVIVLKDVDKMYYCLQFKDKTLITTIDHNVRMRANTGKQFMHLLEK